MLSLSDDSVDRLSDDIMKRSVDLRSSSSSGGCACSHYDHFERTHCFFHISQ